MNKIIAVDIGGVIRTKNEHASIEADNYLEAPVVPGAKEGLAVLIKLYGAANVHLVSRCRLSKQKRSLEWLEHNGIFALGVLRENVHLCVGPQAKLECLRKLAPATLIDDRIKLYPVGNCTRYQFDHRTWPRLIRSYQNNEENN